MKSDARTKKVHGRMPCAYRFIFLSKPGTITSVLQTFSVISVINSHAQNYTIFFSNICELAMQFEATSIFLRILQKVCLCGDKSVV